VSNDDNLPGLVRDFATSHEQLGLHRDGEGWVFREWAPRASALFLTGSFCEWSREAHPLTCSSPDGVWEISLPAAALKQGDLYKVHVVGENGAHDRIPSHARFLIQDEQSHAFAAQVIDEGEYLWENAAPGEVKAPRIYEAHVGMGTEEHRVGSYREFADDILPRIARLGYNVVQLMAVAEHPYYGSFGYHVSNYFAPSSRCGSPDDLRYLVDTAHGLGLAVLMDIVHSHSVKNFGEGLSSFDGQEGLYFHLRDHPQWDSRLFDYGRPEVCRFLLSNVAYWMSEFRFDGSIVPTSSGTLKKFSTPSRIVVMERKPLLTRRAMIKPSSVIRLSPFGLWMPRCISTWLRAMIMLRLIGAWPCIK